MLLAPKPADHDDALAALVRLNVLDSKPEAEFDALVEAAATVCNTPISLISLLDVDRQWFKANVGLERTAQTPRDISFCGHAVGGSELFEIPDALLDERFHDNPLVVAESGIRFYAGAPIALRDGTRIGTLCVVDRQPRHLDDKQRHVLFQLSKAAAHALEGRLALQRQAQITNELETIVAARTQQLELAVQKADIANAAKTEFLSHMSHEIRTPMNGVVGMAYLALQECRDPRQQVYLKRIHESGLHLTAILNGILDFAKVEAGKIELESHQFSLRELLKTQRDQMQLSADAKGLSLRVDVRPGLIDCVVGDPLRMAQVLRNYIDNAIKFTRQGAVNISVSNASDVVNNSFLIRFEVRDTGIGLTDSEAAALFEPFRQANSSTTRLHGGTGLGLAINRRLALLQGGDTGVTSELGRGSTFWFTARVSVGNPHQHMHEPSISSATSALKGIRVLLVEDNEVNREVAAGLLLRVGVQVTCAADGEQALDALQQQDFDCVLMDVQMPVLDGPAATRRLRTAQRNASIPVIALTANASAHDQEVCLAAGMDDFVTKPVTPILFYTTIARWVGTAFSEPPSNMPTAPPRRASQQSLAADTVLDLRVLLECLAGDEDVARQVAQLYVDSIPAITREMDSTRDAARLSAIGHRLKSSSKAVGALRAAAACAALELVDENTVDAAALVLCVKEELARVCDAYTASPL